MSKKLTKADLQFNKNVKERINSDTKENKQNIMFCSITNPIFIPKRNNNKNVNNNYVRKYKYTRKNYY